MRAGLVVVFLTLLLLSGCVSQPVGCDSCGRMPDGSVAPDSGSQVDAGSLDAGSTDAGWLDAGSPDSGAWDAGPSVDLCPAGEKLCLSHDSRRACGVTAQGRRWQDETCAVGSGCVQGNCVVGGCSDECTLGAADGGRVCGVYDVRTAAWVALDAGGSLHDRARDYHRWLQRDGMAAGGVGSARYADPPLYTQLQFMDGIGDSALWTGTYLAAEALRLQSTGSAEARANVRALAAILHTWLSVGGSPGSLARFAIPSGTVTPFQIGDRVCSDVRVHCGVQYQGGAWDYIGHVSRDQYQGVVLGYALAFDALGEEDAAVRDVLRSDMVTLVKELMTERQVQLSIKLNGTRLPTSTVNARFIVLTPSEMLNGALDLQVSTTGGDNVMNGFQEFSPDLADLVREVPGLGWVPAIERPSSAIMLASFFRVALRMTETDPRFAADHAAILAYYTGHTGKGGNVADWLAIADKWAPGTGCNQTYYSNNITLEPLYNLARLEDDPTRRTDVHTLFSTKIWPAFAASKNPFFAFIYAGTVSGVAPQVSSLATAQLAQFPAPPRVHLPVDLRADPRYPHDATCADQVDHATAVDVGDRVVGDFLWQRDPWQLYDPGDLARTEPGVDYLVAYWLGRRHGLIADDTPGRCLAFH